MPLIGWTWPGMPALCHHLNPLFSCSDPTHLPACKPSPNTSLFISSGVCLFAPSHSCLFFLASPSVMEVVSPTVSYRQRTDSKDTETVTPVDDMSLADQKVNDLITAFHDPENPNDTTFNPVILQVFDTKEKLKTFWDGLYHNTRIIYLRSWDLNDYEVSVTQKAFITLFEHRHFTAASNLYFQEILGWGDADTSDLLVADGVKASVESFKGDT